MISRHRPGLLSNHHCIGPHVRRILSISLLLLCTLSLISPLFAASAAESNVPICCRRNGRHHCMMAKFAQRSSSDDSRVKAASIHERCPYTLTFSVAANLPFIPDEIQTAISSGTVSSPARPAQTEARIYISFDRSHQKRGPPSLILSHS